VHFTDKQFVNKLTSIDLPINKLVDNIQVVVFLVKKYWRVVFSKDYLDLIKKVSPDTGNMLVALKLANKHKIVSLRNIIGLLKKDFDDYKESFIVEVDTKEQYESVSWFLEKRFVGWKSLEKKSDMWNVKVSWEWRYYKRWLEQDIVKLLN